MNEQPEHQRRQTKEIKPVRQGDSDRERTAMDDRCDAVRRWIDDNDDPAVRGID
jgi:hypothetical protein